MSTTQHMLDERYGRRMTPARRWIAVAAGALALVAVGAFAWMTVVGAINTVDADATGFQVADEHTVVLEFQFTAPPGKAIACALEAQDEQHGIVGWKVVEIPAADSHAAAFREEIPTTALATTGLVNSCWVT